VVSGEPGAAIVTGDQRRNGGYNDLLHKKARTTHCAEVSEASHLSTLKVFMDRDQAYVMMEEKRLSLRLSDNRLNAYQILGVAGLDPKRRSRLLARFMRAGIGESAE